MSDWFLRIFGKSLNFHDSTSIFRTFHRSFIMKNGFSSPSNPFVSCADFSNFFLIEWGCNFDWDMKMFFSWRSMTEESHNRINLFEVWLENFTWYFYFEILIYGNAFIFKKYWTNVISFYQVSYLLLKAAFLLLLEIPT